VRKLRADVPVLVRTPDDSRAGELKAAGATEVVPEAFEASLMLASHVLMSLKLPAATVMRTVAQLRGNRYEMLRNVIAGGDDASETMFAEQVRSVVLPPGSWCIGKCVDEVRRAGAQVSFTGIRRQGIIGREPASDMRFEDGDIVVIYGTPEALEHAEAVLLAG
jgi:CPA2 family monovalent cation:H+ antiporter-2